MSDTEGKVITCRAVVVKEYNSRLNVESIQVACPQKNEVRVKMVAAGLCHTDIVMSSDTILRQPLPFVLGHEGAGIVESVGENVTFVKSGDKVLTVIIPNCQQCDLCKSKRSNNCEDSWGDQQLSTGYGGTTRYSQQGKPVHHMGPSCFSEYVVVPASLCVKVNPDAELEKACIMACGFPTGYGSTTNAIDIEPGDSVAVWGMGCVGLAAVVGCKERGASRIIAVDTNNDKEAIARKMGATDFINPMDSTRKVQDVIAELNNGGVDFAVNCTSSDASLESAFLSIKRGGAYVIVGFGFKKPLQVDPLFLFRNRRIIGTLYGDFKAKEHFPKLVDRLVDGSLSVDDFITHKFKLDEINEAMDLLKNGKSIRSVIAF